MTDENYRDDYPNLEWDGNRALKELDYQINENPNWSVGERAWFSFLRGAIASSYCSYEDAIKQAEMKGLRNPAYSGDEMGYPADDIEDLAS